jgi:hypothetical protein
MDEKKPDPAAVEQALVKEYTELTGASETTARCVLIHLDAAESERKDSATDSQSKKQSG